VWQLNVSSNLFPNTRLEENYEQICDIDVLPVDLKGILHPKMKMLSWFTHPNVVATLYEFLSSAEEDVLKNVWNFGFIDFHSIFFLLWKSMVPNCFVPIVLQNILIFWWSIPLSRWTGFWIIFNLDVCCSSDCGLKKLGISSLVYTWAENSKEQS